MNSKRDKQTNLAEVIAEFAGFDTPTIANAIEQLNVRNRISGFANRELRCLFPDLSVTCGVAVTAQVRTITAENDGGLDANFVELCKVVAKTSAPSVVVFHEVGPHPEFSAHCGEVMATAFKEYGAVAVVSDSAVRDLEQVHDLGLQYLAPGAVASHGAFRIESIQTPVTVCDLSVAPGDLLHGDANGLVSIPIDGRARLPKIAKDICQAEQKIMQLIRQGPSAIALLCDHLCH